MRVPFRPFLIAAALAPWPSALTAHPHVFIDAGLRLIVEDGRVTAVEVTWLYDGLYTLLLLEDYGLDEDYDLALTEAEVDATLGFDLDWGETFDGGLELSRGGVPMEIGPPEPVGMALVGEEGQMQTVHRRPVTDPGGDGPLVAQAYDPEFYAAMEMTGEMVVEGLECEAELIRPDLDAAYAVLDDMMTEIGGSVAAEDNFPMVGEHFADRVVFTCAG
ncbi:DUF1007 family protein [Rhodobacterales bacterium HKCCE4037]|nr:DUF1007 family protein [Rhodobacterales bacterium HKCCE4037]